MKIEKLEYNGDVYYCTFHKFANINEEIIFCEKSDNKYIPVENKRILKKLNKEFPEIKIKDIV